MLWRPILMFMFEEAAGEGDYNYDARRKEKTVHVPTVAEIDAKFCTQTEFLNLPI